MVAVPNQQAVQQSLQNSVEVQQTWDFCIEVFDWRHRRWRFNYTKYPTADGWCLNWEILTPNGKVKASGEKDLELAYRCLNESGLIDNDFLQYEVKWWVRHYTNIINIKALKAAQQSE